MLILPVRPWRLWSFFRLFVFDFRQRRVVILRAQMHFFRKFLAALVLLRPEMHYRNLGSLRRSRLRKSCAPSGPPWKTPFLFIPFPSCPSILGRSCAPVRPCCIDLMYLRGIPFSYKIAHSILRPMLSQAFDMSRNITWFAFLCFAPFWISMRASMVDLFGLYAACASSVGGFIRGIILLPKLHARILYIALSRATVR